LRFASSTFVFSRVLSNAVPYRKFPPFVQGRLVMGGASIGAKDFALVNREMPPTTKGHERLLRVTKRRNHKILA